MIYIIAIYFTLVLIFIFGIKPYLYTDKKRTIKLLIPMWVYVLVFIFGFIPVYNIITLMVLTIVITSLIISNDLFFENNNFFNFLGRKL